MGLENLMDDRNLVGGDPGVEPVGVEPTPSVPPQAPPPHPESQALIRAIDSGYADKKMIGPVESIREGIQTGDTKLIEKGHKGIYDILYGSLSFGTKYADTMIHGGRMAATAHKMASDIVINEMNRGSLTPTAEEATGLGLIHPQELMANQTQQMYGNLIPAEPFAMTPEGMPVTRTEMLPTPAQPGQKGVTSIRPGVKLTPFQSEIVEARQKGLSAGLAVRQQLADLRALETPSKIRSRESLADLRTAQELDIPSRQLARESLNQLHDAQIGLTNARTAWYNQLPGLRKELAGAPPFEMEALKRVHQAITEGKKPTAADMLVWRRWMTKGGLPFSADVTGKIFDRLTGRSERKGGTFGWPDMANLPDLTPDEEAEAESTDNDFFHQLGGFLGSLLSGVTSTPTPAKPEAAPKKETVGGVAPFNDAEKEKRYQEFKKKHK